MVKGREHVNTRRQAVNNLLFYQMFYKGCQQRLEEEGEQHCLLYSRRAGPVMSVKLSVRAVRVDQEGDAQNADQSSNRNRRPG